MPLLQLRPLRLLVFLLNPRLVFRPSERLDVVPSSSESDSLNSDVDGVVHSLLCEATDSSRNFPVEPSTKVDWELTEPCLPEMESSASGFLLIRRVGDRSASFSSEIDRLPSKDTGRDTLPSIISSPKALIRQIIRGLIWRGAGVSNGILQFSSTVRTAIVENLCTKIR